MKMLVVLETANMKFAGNRVIDKQMQLPFMGCMVCALPVQHRRLIG